MGAGLAIDHDQPNIRQRANPTVRGPSFAETLTSYKVVPRLLALTFGAVTVHLAVEIVDSLQGGHDLTDTSFIGVCGLVSVMSLATGKAVDYIRDRKGE